MERRLTVEFGPSRSKRFAKAVAEAQNGPGECTEVEPGRYRTSFALGGEAAVYAGLARLLERVRHWRATGISEEEEPVSAYHAREMGWCAAFYLDKFGGCRHRFYYGILPRCALCPLFDGERAIRDALGENTPPGNAARDHARPQPAGAHARPAPTHTRRGVRAQLPRARLPPARVERLRRRGRGVSALA